MKTGKLGKYVHCEEGAAPLILTMPHSGVEIPDGIEHKLDLSKEHVQRTLNNGIDLCVPFATGASDYTSATRIWTTLPRVVLDVNRSVDDVDEHSVEGISGEGKAHGLIWRSSVESEEKNIKPLLTAPYTHEEFYTLLTEAYFPYVNTEERQMDRVYDDHGRAVMFCLHSMPCTMPGIAKEGMHAGAYLMFGEPERGSLKEGKLPDLLMLDKGELCSPEITDKVIEIFRDHGLLIETLDIGAKTVKSPVEKLADPANGMHVLGIEIVGRGLEPGRREGKSRYDPRGAERYRKAFKDVFGFLESYKG